MPWFPHIRLREGPGGVRDSSGGFPELICPSLPALLRASVQPPRFPWLQSRTVMKPLIPLLAGVTVIWEVVTPKKGLGSADLVRGVGQPGQPAPIPGEKRGSGQHQSGRLPNAGVNT